MENSYSHNPEGLNGLQVPSGIPVYEHTSLPYTNSKGEEIHVFQLTEGLRTELYASRQFLDKLKNWTMNIYEDAELWHCIEIQTNQPPKQPWWKRLVRALFNEPKTWPQPAHLYLPTGLPSMKGAQIGDYLVLNGNTYRIMELIPMNPVVVASQRLETSDNIYTDPL